MLLIAVGMGFGLVGLRYMAVSGTTDEDAGIASGVQRAADQLGGAGGGAVYVGIGFAPLCTLATRSTRSLTGYLSARPLRSACGPMR
jgi:hypothetical protein